MKTLTLKFIVFSVCIVWCHLSVGQGLAKSYFFNTPTLYNTGLTGLESYSDIKIGTQRKALGKDQGPESNFVTINIPVVVKKRSRGPKRLKYKSPFDIDQLASEVKVPDNGMRMSNPDLVQKVLKDSIRKSVAQLDRKRKELLRKKLKQKTFKTSFHHGFGATVMSESVGPLGFTSLALNYALHIPVSKQSTLSIGAGVSQLQGRFDVQALQFEVADDPVIEKYRSANERYSGINLGIAWYTERVLIAYGRNNNVRLSSSERFEELFDDIISNRNTLSLLVRANPSSELEWLNGISRSGTVVGEAVTDFTSRMVYKEFLGFGVNYSTSRNLAGNVFAKLSDYLMVGYIYDHPLSNSSTNLKSFHQVSLNILLSPGSSPKSYFY